MIVQWKKKNCIISQKTLVSILVYNTSIITHPNAHTHTRTFFKHVPVVSHQTDTSRSWSSLQFDRSIRQLCQPEEEISLLSAETSTFSRLAVIKNYQEYAGVAKLRLYNND